MLKLALMVELFFVISFPLALGAWLRWRFRSSWLLFTAGAVTFGLAQAVHLPLNLAIFAFVGKPGVLPGWATPLILGLTAGVCEETARYAAYRWALREVRRWREALMFGAGHGGIESIVFVGLILAVFLPSMTLLQGADLEAWGLPLGQVHLLRQQLDVYWRQSWTTPLLAAVERLFSIVFHMGMAVLILQSVTRRQPGYWLLAIGLHAAGNALAAGALDAGWDLVAVEGLIGLFALAALAIILGLRPQPDLGGETMPDPRSTHLPQPTGGRTRPTSAERLRQQIEESKYER